MGIVRRAVRGYALQRHGTTAQAGHHSLDQVHDLSLRLNVRLYVALGRAQSGMSRQHLHVSERVQC